MIQKLLLRNSRNFVVNLSVINKELHNLAQRPSFLYSSPSGLQICSQNNYVQLYRYSTLPDPRHALSSDQVDQLDTNEKQKKVVAPNKHSNEILVKPLAETRWQRIKAECIHYYHGFRLFLVEVKIAARLLVKVFFGKQLSRRERKHFTRTAADIFRIVPFAVFIVVPFMEFLLPFYLKFFPGMLPSTFKVKSKQEEKLRKQMKVKLQVAKFLQDTLEETALHSKNQISSDDIKAFTEFMRAVRSGNRQPTNEEILKFAALLEDELTLENLNHLQLVCLCQLLNLSSVGPDYVLRLQIQLRLRLLHADDKLIQRDGIESLTSKELQKACRDRGMCYFGISTDRLKSQLRQWVDFHLNRRIPVTLLLLSRSFYLPDMISPEKMLTDTIAHLPIDVEKTATRKLAQSQGLRIDNKEKLDELRKEEEAIAKENKEIEEDIVMLPEPTPIEEQQKISGKLEGSDSLHIPIADTELVASRLASALMYIASKKNIDLSELEYDEFKEEVDDYRTDNVQTSRSEGLLTKRITKLLDNVNSLSFKLHKKQKWLRATIEDSEEQLSKESSNDKLSSEMDILKSKREDLVHLNELLGSLKHFHGSANNLDENVILDVIKQLDLDGDNHIAIADLLQVLECIYSSGQELSRQRLEEIAELVAKERLVEET